MGKSGYGLRTGHCYSAPARTGSEGGRCCHLSLFGSTARGDCGRDSDVDLLAAFDESKDLSLLDVVHIENQIAELLGTRVDLIEEGTLKPRVQGSVEAEAVRAF